MRDDLCERCERCCVRDDLWERGGGRRKAEEEEEEKNYRTG